MKEVCLAPLVKPAEGHAPLVATLEAIFKREPFQNVLRLFGNAFDASPTLNKMGYYF